MATQALVAGKGAVNVGSRHLNGAQLVLNLLAAQSVAHVQAVTLHAATITVVAARSNMA